MAAAGGATIASVATVGMAVALPATVASENFESFHNHSAYATIERDKRPA